MTRYKNWLRKQGVQLECDYEYLPYNGLECVKLELGRNGVCVHEFYNNAGWYTMLFKRDGSYTEYWKD